MHSNHCAAAIFPCLAIVLEGSGNMSDKSDSMGLDVITKLINDDMQGCYDLVITDLRHDV